MTEQVPIRQVPYYKQFKSFLFMSERTFGKVYLSWKEEKKRVCKAFHAVCLYAAGRKTSAAGLRQLYGHTRERRAGICAQEDCRGAEPQERQGYNDCPQNGYEVRHKDWMGCQRGGSG